MSWRQAAACGTFVLVNLLKARPGMSYPRIGDGSNNQSFFRRKRELKTVAAMLRMHCRSHHGAQSGLPCPRCARLLEYARRRLQRCIFGDAKPTCANCSVHCYSADKREQIRVVMKWAGPRMLLHHPVLAICHLLDGRRPAPILPARDGLRGDPGTLQDRTTQV